MKTIQYCLSLSLLLGFTSGLTANAQTGHKSLEFSDTPEVLVPESSGFVPHDPVRGHTRLRVLNLPDTVRPMVTAQFNNPASVRALYNLPANGGSNAIAIVDSYHFPTAQADFNIFSRTFGLPLERSWNPNAATNQHFQVVYATGYRPRSGGNYIQSWNLEAALDIQWAHAMAPNAKIYLVEAASDSNADLFYAVRVAAALPGVKEVSMSWGGSESTYETWAYDSIFAQPGVVYFASGGDTAARMSYPAASPNVVSCGGTSINRAVGGQVVSETAWNATGCGPSAYEPRPAFQDAVAAVVGNQRGVSDLSFVADPSTGVYVYDSTGVWGQRGWFILGGTSVSSPALAGVVNVAATSGNGFATSSGDELNRIYANLGNAAAFRDVISGNANQWSAQLGYDFVTGVGTPNGLVGK